MLTAIANKRKIEEATSQKDDVAPAMGMVEFINRRLTHKSPIVKQKTLRLIKFICGKGASDFKRGISKQAGTVRELTHYKGDPDPFKGDIPNQKVRDMAKEAVEAIFAPTDTPSYTAPSTSGLQNRIQGFGSTPASESASAGGNAASKGRSGMLGFAKPWNDTTSRNASRHSSSKGFGRRGGYEGPGDAAKSGMMGGGALSPKGIIQSISAKGGELMQGRRSQGFLSSDDHAGYSSDEADQVYTRPGPNPSAQPSSLGPLQRANGSQLKSTAGDAARLVNQICTPGGLRAQPSREDLRIFVESVGSHSGQEVAELLEDKLVDPSWQAALRSLSALEAVIQQGSSVPCGEIAVYFQTNPDALEAALDLPQASVRQRATRVLHLLGLDSSAVQSGGAQEAPDAEQPDLLGGLTDETAAAQDPRPSGGDMLGDLLDNVPASPKRGEEHSQSGGMFSGLEFSSENPASAQAQEPADLLGGPTPQAVQPPSAPQASSSMSDPFSNFQGTPIAQGPAEPISDLFGGMSMGQSSQQTPSADNGDLLGAMEPLASTAAAPGSSNQAPNGNMADMFAGLSSSDRDNSHMQATASQAPASSGPRRPLSSLQLAPQKSAHLDRLADPLASVGLPQPQHAPMGQGFSAQRGAPAGTSMQGLLPPQQHVAATPMGMTFPGGQMTPQQAQYMRQMQYMQFMQMQAMQARAMGAAGPQQMGYPSSQPQMPGFNSFQQPLVQPKAIPFAQGQHGLGGGNPISLESLTGPVATAGNSSSALGISKQSDFDFVNDHVKGLRGKR